jgi:hypothetical protein
MMDDPADIRGGDQQQLAVVVLAGLVVELALEPVEAFPIRDGQQSRRLGRGLRGKRRPPLLGRQRVADIGLRR